MHQHISSFGSIVSSCPASEKSARWLGCFKTIFKALVMLDVTHHLMPKRSDGMEGFKKSNPLAEWIESSKILEQPSCFLMAVSNFTHNFCSRTTKTDPISRYPPSWTAFYSPKGSKSSICIAKGFDDFLRSGVFDQTRAEHFIMRM